MNLVAGKMWGGMGGWLLCRTMGWDGIKTLDSMPPRVWYGFSMVYPMGWYIHGTVPCAIPFDDA